MSCAFTILCLLQVKIKKIVKDTQLHLCYKHLPNDLETTGFYFIRNTPDPIPIATDPSTTLPKLFEMGTLSSKPLNTLDTLLRHIYMPLLKVAGQKSGEEATIGSGDVPKEQEEKSQGGKMGSSRGLPLRDELLIGVDKFATHIQQTIQQIEGDVKLEIPEIDLQADPVKLSRDQPLVSQLEKAVDRWSRVISITLEEQFTKYPQGNGPLAEIEFWKERNSALNALYLQLQVPSALAVLAVLKAAGSASQVTFEITKSDLNKYYVEAKDNVKFLMTLERHFKIIAHGSSLQSVSETIPAMMNSLRMVWVISRHYNTDERMVPLMERIAWELCERVARVIDVKTIFKYVFCKHVVET